MTGMRAFLFVLIVYAARAQVNFIALIVTCELNSSVCARLNFTQALNIVTI